MLGTPRKSLSRLYNGRMIPRRKIPRSAAQKARDTAGIIGSLKHEGYVPTPGADSVHQRVARGEITAEEAIGIFRARALALEAKLKRE